MTASVDVRAVPVADVYKDGRLAGTLARVGGAVELRYDTTYLDDPGPAIAWSLPVSSEVVRVVGGAVPAFFAGLLPEGRRLSVLWRTLKASADDELSLLLAVGSDTVGDVQVVPAGETPRPAEAAVVVERWNEVSFSDLLNRSIGETDDPMVDRMGLAGVQPKLSGRVISLPVTTGVGRWILKLSPPDYPYLVENESFFLEAARRSGLEVADAEVVTDRIGIPGLLVRRFDRVADDDGTVRSLAQEDACQVLGLHPADKYNVTSEQAARALVACTRAQPTAAADVFRQIVFAWLTGDGDVHAKNLSVGCRSTGEWLVTPAYDLPSTRPYGDTTLALSIDGHLDGLRRSHLLAFARAIGLREGAAGKVIDLLTERADEWIDRLGELPFDERRIRDLGRLARRRQRDLRVS